MVVRAGPQRRRTLKHWCLQAVMLERTPQSSLDSKGMKPISLKGNQPWTLIGRTDAKAKTPVLWSPDANSLLIGKVPDAGNDWGQKEKMTSEDEMAEWYHWCNGHEPEKYHCWRGGDTLNIKDVLIYTYFYRSKQKNGQKCGIRKAKHIWKTSLKAGYFEFGRNIMWQMWKNHLSKTWGN